MAQDFGDDAGELLVRSIGDAVRRQLDRFVGDKAAEWFAALGKPQEEAAALAAREQVCIRFGDKAEAVAFAKVLEQNKLYCAALVDKEGNGYVQFFADDLMTRPSRTRWFAPPAARPRRSPQPPRPSLARPVLKPLPFLRAPGRQQGGGAEPPMGRRVNGAVGQRCAPGTVGRARS